MTPGYDARIARAEFLIGNYPFAVEILTYYTRICAAQKKLRGELERALGKKSAPGSAELREQIDVDLVAPRARSLLKNLEKHSPRPLGEFITEFLGRSEARRAVALQDYVSKGGTDESPADCLEQLVAAILVQPYAELLAAKLATPPAVIEGNLCPKCAARPVAGVLRVEGDGGKRFLLCSFCGTEWEFRRIFCAYCAETREGSLPVFVAEKFPHLRVEACDACRHCLRTVDLTKDGNAIPVVDDLAAIPLALWAEESGYTRIHNNLLGT
jgi:formate dehydrogenase accessory protein FdhE